MPADLRFVAHAAERHADELPVERGRDRFGERGLAHAGRADQREDRARAPTALGGRVAVAHAALGAQLAHRQVLDDAVLHVLEPGVVLVQDPPGVGDVEVVLGPDVPRHVDQPVEVGPDPAVLGRLLGGALQPAQLVIGLLADLLGHAGLGDLLAVLLDHRLAVLALAELLANGLHLLAQDELALGLVQVLLDVLADAVLDGDLGQGLLGPGQDLFQAPLDVEGLQQLDPLLHGQVRRVAGGIGQGRGVGDATEHLGHLRDPAGLDDVLHRGPVVASQLAGAGRVRVLLVGLGDLDPGGVAGPGHPGADHGPVQGPDDQGLHTVLELPGVLDGGHHAHGGVAALQAGDQQEEVARLARGGHGRPGLGRFQGQRDNHPRQHHPLGQRQERQDRSFQLFRHVQGSS